MKNISTFDFVFKFFREYNSMKSFIPTIFVVLNYNEAIIFQKNLTNSAEITMTPVENDLQKMISGFFPLTTSLNNVRKKILLSGKSPNFF